MYTEEDLDAAARDGDIVPAAAGTTDDDRRTAMRFVLGRPGWRVEARADPRGGTHLGVTTPCPDTGGQRQWRVERTRRGLAILDEGSGQTFKDAATMREALVDIWEAVAETASDD